MNTFTVDKLSCDSISSSVSGKELVIGRRGSRTAVAGSLAVNAATQADSFTLPTTKGSLSQVLTTDGEGNTSWATLSSGGYDQDLNTTSSVQFASVDVAGQYTLPTVAGTPGQVLQSTGGSTTEFASLPDYGLQSVGLQQFADTSAADFYSVITGTTGTGSVVFNDSPTLVTPHIGAAKATSVDTPAPTDNLVIGQTANSVTISQSLAVTNIKGSAVVEETVYTNEIDAIPGGSALSIGENNATSVTLAKSGVPVIVSGYTLPPSPGAPGQVLQMGISNTVGFFDVPTAPNAALTDQPLSQFAAAGSTSADLAGIISDETGSAGGGLLVFNESPTLVTPNIGDAIASSVDAPVWTGGPNPLYIGPNNAHRVIIASTSYATFIEGPLYVNGLIDGASSAVVSIGTGTTAGVNVGKAGAPVTICGSYTLPDEVGTAGFVLTSQGATSAWVQPVAFTTTFGGTNVAPAFCFPSNGTILSLQNGFRDLGSVFLVPCACTLKNVTIHASAASGSVQICKTGISQTVISINDLKVIGNTSISFEPLDELEIRTETGPLTLMITCLFFSR